MANLKGSSYEKQVSNAFHRLEAFGVSRHGSNDHNTHSIALGEKREMYLNDYMKFAENQNYSDKLNQTMTTNNMDKFLNTRLEGLSLKTQTDYVRGWSSMIQGLKENNIAVAVDRNYFDTKVSDIKVSEPKESIKTDRAIYNVGMVIDKLYSLKYESAVIAEVQLDLGLRVSEAIELIQNHNEYIHNNEVNELIGKGNHVYDTKAISSELVAKIEAVDNLPHENTYRNDLAIVTYNNHTPHDFRYTYALREFNSKIEANIPYNQILREISESLNHSRESMTNYYLSRA
jgi:integrase